MKKMKVNKKGFTLIEMLVVVLIIGILAGIALPQYQMAVTKAKVASMLPLMRRWKDALMEWKLTNGSYCTENEYCDESPDGADLGVNWPSDWQVWGSGLCGDSTACDNDYWDCQANEGRTGYVYCQHFFDNNDRFMILMYQPDEEEYRDLRGMTTCECESGSQGEKVCKVLGGKLLDGVRGYDPVVYKLN